MPRLACSTGGGSSEKIEPGEAFPDENLVPELVFMPEGYDQPAGRCTAWRPQ